VECVRATEIASRRAAAGAVRGRGRTERGVLDAAVEMQARTAGLDPLHHDTINPFVTFQLAPAGAGQNARLGSR